ncbi:hypothetical protein EON63_08805 [archaeon]|nr:MAG: hypothetical protein EON63_08805 [archaeon]
MTNHTYPFCPATIIPYPSLLLIPIPDRLQNDSDETIQTIPTIGFNVEVLQYKNIKFQVCLCVFVSSVCDFSPLVCSMPYTHPYTIHHIYHSPYNIHY